MENLLSDLKGASDVTFFPPCDGNEGHATVKLPEPHSEILAKTNGVATYGGYFRLWGSGKAEVPNLEGWNEKQCWKFAWNGRADDFLCFGTTAWGDQYAYHTRSLTMGRDAEVFLLDAITMEAEVLSSNFEAFWKEEFIRNAFDPYDSMVIKHLRGLGKLEFDELLVFDPPLQLGGTEDTATCKKMSARAVMVANGDLTSQLDSLPDYAQISGVESSIDDLGRARLRLVTKG